jgi:hypothetical protein
LSTDYRNVGRAGNWRVGSYEMHAGGLSWGIRAALHRLCCPARGEVLLSPETV